MNMTVKVTIETKKGQTQNTQWGVWQERPFPDIEKGGRFKWRNGEGLFPNFNGPAQGIGRNYTAVLLRSDLTKRENNRKDYAGYQEDRNTPENPGCIVYRGKSLGETSIKIDSHGYATIRTRYGSYPDTTTAGEREFVKAAVVPGLIAFIEANRAELKAEAIAAIRETVKRNLADARQDIDELEAEAEAAIKAEESRKA